LFLYLPFLFWIASFTSDVRLIGSTADTAGVVEYYDGSNWVTICPTEWDDTDAVVVCRSLGYDGGTVMTYAKDLWVFYNCV